MAFAQVKSVQDHKGLIDEFLKNREILKKCIMDEKIGKQHFQEDVAQPLQQPIKAESDNQQDKLIERLQEGQDALTLTQTDIVKPIKAILGAPELPALPASEALPAMAEAATLPRATSISPEAPIVTYRINEKLINDLGLPPPFLRESPIPGQPDIKLSRRTVKRQRGSRPDGNQTQNRCCTRLYTEA